MATTLYFHSDASAVGGTLPATEQSTEDTEQYTISFPEPFQGVDMSGTHLLMDDTQGSSENDAYLDARNNTVEYDTQQTDMIAQFVSEPLSAGGIAADNWVVHVDATGGEDAGFTAKIDFSAYLWRPSTGAKITSIVDNAATEDSTTSVVNDFETRQQYSITRSGASATAQAGDVIIIELWTWARSISVSASALWVFYDTGTDGRVVAPDLPFGPPPEPPPPIPQVGVFDPHLDPQAWF